MAAKTRAKQRREETKWATVFGLLLELAPSPAMRQAARRVFGTIEPEAATVAPEPELPALSNSLRKVARLIMLQRFESSHSGCRAADIYRLLHVHKSDWYKWRRGELPDGSSVTQRIEAYLAKV